LIHQIFPSQEGFSKLLIFDRDRTLIEDAGQTNHQIDPIFIKRTQLILKNLNLSNTYLAIATNQRGINGGGTKIVDYESFNRKLVKEFSNYGIRFSSIVTCPHLKSDACKCRKPNPEMLHFLLSFTGVERKSAMFIGDTESDFSAAKTAEIDFFYINDIDIQEKLTDWLKIDNC
jgi:histidinol-phosphate phosphatase family protein